MRVAKEGDGELVVQAVGARAGPQLVKDGEGIADGPGSGADD